MYFNRFNALNSLSFNQESFDYDEYQGGFKKTKKVSTSPEDQEPKKYPVKKPKKISKEHRQAKRNYEG